MHCKMFLEAFDHANEQNVDMRSMKAVVYMVKLFLYRVSLHISFMYIK